MLLSQEIVEVAKEQSEYINNLKDLDKVRKDAMIAYYSHKDFYQYFNKDWYPEERIDKTIKLLGDKFLKK